MRGRIREIEIDSTAYDVIDHDVLARRTKSQRSLIFKNMAGVLKLFQVTLVKISALTLHIRSEIAADVRSFVPIQAQPFQAFVNGGHRFLGVSLAISVFNTQHKFSAVMPRKQPVKKRSARPTYVQKTGG